MNNTIYDIDLTRMLPPSLKEDEKILSLGRVIAGELQKNATLARQSIIYARIDELDENILDILAYDLHVDWYDYTYSIEAKRALIKDSVRVHKRLGTKFAVETALGGLHPNSYIEEWFQYGGEPFSFRVVLDTTHSRAGAGYFEIRKAVESYKRLSAHMDDLIYQCTVNIVVGIETRVFVYSSGMTGKVLAGTVPQRNVVGGVEQADMTIQGSSQGYKFTSPAAGTVPDRSTIAALRENTIVTPLSGEGFPYSVEMTGKTVSGTVPQRNIVGVAERAEMAFEGDLQGFKYESPIAGTKPGRSTQAEAESGGLLQTVTAEGYKYNVKRCGMRPFVKKD